VLLNSVYHAGSGKRSGRKQIKIVKDNPKINTSNHTKAILLLDKHGIDIIGISNVMRMKHSVIKFVIENKNLYPL